MKYTKNEILEFNDSDIMSMVNETDLKEYTNIINERPFKTEAQFADFMEFALDEMADIILSYDDHGKRIELVYDMERYRDQLRSKLKNYPSIDYVLEIISETQGLILDAKIDLENLRKEA